MKNKNILYSFLILGTIVLSGCTLTTPKSEQKPIQGNNTATGLQQKQPEVTGSTSTSEVAKTYTMDEVKAANSADKCWTVINGSVYDVTSFTNKHKGGDKAVLSTCGIDATTIYDGQHGGQKKPANVLNSFYIGKLK